MSNLTTQDFDAVTAPSISITGWTVDGTLVTSAAQSTTGANSLAWVAGSGSAVPSATWNTADGVGGNVVAAADLQIDPPAGVATEAILCARWTASVGTFGSGTFYFASLQATGSTAQVYVGKHVGGSQATLAGPVGSLAWGAWYRLTLTLDDSQTNNLALQVVRKSDGFYLTSGGTFQSGAATCLSVADSAVTGSGKAGIAFYMGSASSGKAAYADHFTLDSLGSSLAAGTPSLSASSATTAAVSYSGATGGTSPYSYQLRKAPDSSGSPGTFSNLGSALTGQSGAATFPADTGLTTGVKVWYQVVATDAASASATSSNLAVTPTAPAAVTYIAPGAQLRDTAGDPLQLHGGSVLWDDRTGLYWGYGEDLSGTQVPAGTGGYTYDGVVAVGVRCYSSPDLLNWTPRGLCLTPTVNGTTYAILERPKVHYNASTGRYYLLIHLDNGTYTANLIAVLSASTPAGPFTTVEYAPAQIGGNPSKDIGTLLDDDGTLYVYFASTSQGRVVAMNPAWNGFGTSSAINTGALNPEAFAPFKVGPTYYLLCSSQTTWTANLNHMFSSTSVTGTLTELASPFVSASTPGTAPASTSYASQSCQVLRTLANQYVSLADRFVGTALGTSGHVWLPLSFDAPGVPLIPWTDAWTPAAPTALNLAPRHPVRFRRGNPYGA